MIVYSDRKRSESPRELLGRLLRELGGSTPDASALLMQAGMLESGVVDAVSPEVDGHTPLASRLDEAMLDLALGARGDGERRTSAHRRLAAIAADLPQGRIDGSEPEGFAFYALYPETYAGAARRFLQAERPRSAVVVGVRSIGTTLSAVVAAELLAHGVQTSRFTVRPRGHPWDRELRLSPALTRTLSRAEHVLVVDEGPGISGSSFASVAEAASAAGVPFSRIHLFPSWDADGSGLRSERARVVWPLVKRWTQSFEESFLGTGRLATAWGGGTLRDLSGGLWRAVAYPAHGGTGRWPAVQPQHERRKYLLEQADGTRLLLKFVGLGERGSRMFERAAVQAEAGLAPRVVGLRDGFLAQEWLQATPADAGDGFSAARTERRHGPTFTGWSAAMGTYLAFLGAEPVGPARFDDILSMTRLNVAEGLGEEWIGRLAWMERMRAAVEARPAVAVDGRMLPQEWVRTGAGGTFKCDGLEHHDDHFWPGTQDIAWDLAGAMVEWGMDAGMREELLGSFEHRAGPRGRDVRRVLPFYEASYLAWRLGYTTLAAETLGDSEDGRRMARDRGVYAGLLCAALERGDG